MLDRWWMLGLMIVLAGCSGSRNEPAGGAAACDSPPALTVPTSTLDAALACSAGLASATRAPVLLVPGTATTPDTAFSWNHQPALEAMGWPYCTVELPESAMADAQVSAEYIVHAIRQMARLSGRRVAVVGYSQGGMLPRWALRFYPDIREHVEELVGLAPSNHGTETAAPTCVSGCQPSIWQQRSDAAFIAALNADFETVAGVDYTVIYTQLDEVVVPNAGPNPSSPLRAQGEHLANIATQSVCPANAADHLALGTYDPVAHALLVDALTHPGPADQTRLAGYAGAPGTAAVCAEVFMPGVNPATFALDYGGLLAGISEAAANTERVDAEPALRCFADPAG